MVTVSPPGTSTLNAPSRAVTVCVAGSSLRTVIGVPAATVVSSGNANPEMTIVASPAGAVAAAAAVVPGAAAAVTAAAVVSVAASSSSSSSPQAAPASASAATRISLVLIAHPPH